MHRIDHESADLTMNGPGKPGFTGGDPDALVEPTVLTAKWANAVQEELAGVIEPLMSLDDTAKYQLQQALSFGFGLLAGATLELRFTAEGSMIDACSDDGSTIVVITEGSGSDSRVVSAADGWTFAQRTLGGGTSNGLTVLAWAPGPRLFVAGGQNGEIQTSPDGVTWTKRTQALGYAGTWNGIAASDDAIVLVGDAGMVQRSVDGVTWTAAVSAFGATGLAHATYSGNASRFLAIANDHAVMWSSDGETWLDADTTAEVTHVGPGPRGFIGVNETDETLLSSVDGTSWDTEAAATNFVPKHVSQSGIITGHQFPGGAGSLRAAITPERPPRPIAQHLADALNTLVHTRAAWIGGGAAGTLYVSQSLPF